MSNIKLEKIQYWKKKLVELESQLRLAAQRRGEAAQMGDLSENAAFQYASEEVDVYQARIAEVQQIIADLEKGKK